MAAVTIRLLGTGDAVGSGGRFHTCFHLEAGAASLLIDCGASAMQAMKAGGVRTDAIDAILLSHLHGDHFGGIPFFLIDCQFISRRSRVLTVAGPPGVEARVRTVTEAMFPRFLEASLTFPLEFIELAARQPTALGPLEVTAAEVRHPSGAPAYALRLAVGGKVVAFSGDTEWTDALVDVARGADVFICECYTYDSVIPWHISYRVLEAHRSKLDCRRLLLTHMSDEMLERAGSLDIETASDGQTVIP